MICVKCGKELMEGVVFCPYCGEKAIQGEPGMAEPIYQVNVKRTFKSGKLVVYHDRTEFITSSVQKAIFNYDGLVAIKKEWDHIDFITEDGSTEACPADRKCVHEAFLYIERASKPYLAKRKECLLSQGIRYSFLSSQGIMSNGILNLSAEQAEFKAKSGKSDIVSYRDVKAVKASAGTLDFLLFGGGNKSFSINKEMRDEVLAFVTDAIAPYLAQRKEALLAQGIYFSFLGSDGGNLDVLADRVEYKGRSGQVETVISFQDVRKASFSVGMLELALTNGTSKSFLVDADAGSEVLAFVEKAIEPYVMARTVGFDMVFGIDERIEMNEERGVFHIIRQSGREITDEWPLDALIRCEWTESKELTALGNVVSGGIALFKSAAKVAGSQANTQAEERISCAGTILTVRTEQGIETKNVWFGIFSAGMNRANKKYDRYLAEWARFSDYLKSRCPTCELVEHVALDPVPELPLTAEPSDSEELGSTEITAGGEESAKTSIVAAQLDDLGIAKYIEGVSQFIGKCTSPMTIAFQGNRGSGENSILRILFNQLREHYGDNLLWLNVRQFPSNESGEALSVLIGKKLTELVSGESNTAETLLTGLAEIVTGAIAGDSSIGKNIIGAFNKGAVDSSEQLVKLFGKQIEAKTQAGNDKVVLFVDGLDRLASARVVELLEAMRDFFDCNGCVFVVAVDYGTVLSGAQGRYGERETKRFFDGMFRMSFRVPASSYNVKNYMKSRLDNIGVQAEDEAELDLYAALIQNSVGKDPEAVDRLVESFQLLKHTAGEEVYESRYKRLVLFALLCMQTSFRNAYDYAVQMKNSLTPEFLAGLCGESAQFWDTADEMEAYRDFGGTFAQIINLDDDADISETECRAFAEVLELSCVTSR